jgi:hypothetical protein
MIADENSEMSFNQHAQIGKRVLPYAQPLIRENQVDR